MNLFLDIAQWVCNIHHGEIFYESISTVLVFFCSSMRVVSWENMKTHLKVHGVLSTLLSLVFIFSSNTTNGHIFEKKTKF